MKKNCDHVSNETNPSGSPQYGEPGYIMIGKLRRPHGVKGELIMEIMADFLNEVRPDMTILIGQEKKPCILATMRSFDQLFLISLKGFEDRESVSVFNNQLVYAEASKIGSLPEGRFFQREVIGMQVLDENGNHIGKISEILETGANDVYVIATPDNGEILIPAVKHVVISMSRETNSMVVHLQEWE